MRKHTFDAGDLLTYSLGVDRIALIKVLFVSQYFQKIVLLGVHGEAFGSDSRPDVKDLSFSRHLLYTSSQGLLKRQGWKVYAKSTVAEREKELSTRIVGGEVWLEDELLRVASEEEFGKLPRMDVLGHKLLEKKIRRLMEVLSSAKIPSAV